VNEPPTEPVLVSATPVNVNWASVVVKVGVPVPAKVAAAVIVNVPDVV
jgi:hypothetical protein